MHTATTQPILRAGHRARCNAAVAIAHAERLLSDHGRTLERERRQTTDEALLTLARLSDRDRAGDAQRVLASHAEQADRAAAAPVGAPESPNPINPYPRSSAAAPVNLAQRAA